VSAAEEHKRALERYYAEAINKGNLDVIYESAHPDHVSHGTGENGKSGAEHLREWARLQRASFPDLHVTVEDWIIEGDKVVGRFTARGTHTGEPYVGIPTSGRSVEISGIVIDEFSGNKIVESWLLMEEMKMAQQLGVFG
jgi:predicted ester cyclase